MVNRSRRNKRGGMPIEKDISCPEIRTLRVHTGRRIWDLAFYPKEPIMATSSADNTVKLWRFLPNGSVDNTPVASLRGHRDYLLSLEFHPTEPLLATVSHDNTAKLWRFKPDGSVATRVATLNVNGVCRVAFHPTLPLLATSSIDKTINVWRLLPNMLMEQQTPVSTLIGDSRWVNQLAFHPTLPLLATCSYDRTVILWRVNPDGSAEQTPVSTLNGHSASVRSVAFHPTLPLLVTSSVDKTVKLWRFNIEGSEPICVETISGDNYSVAFHPTMALFATGSTDGTVKLWRFRLDGSAATPVATLRGHLEDVLSVAFHPTLPVLTTRYSDNTAKLWDISKINEYLRKIIKTRAGLASKLIKAFTTNPISNIFSLQSSNQVQGRVGNPPDVGNEKENRARLAKIVSKKYVEFPRAALHQPGAPLTSMSVDSSASLRPSAPIVQLQPSYALTSSSSALSVPEVPDVSSVCRPDDKECNAVYDSKFWDIVKEMHISCSDRSEILKKIEELKGYRALLIEQGNPPGITNIWIKKLEKKISGCSK